MHCSPCPPCLDAGGRRRRSADLQQEEASKKIVCSSSSSSRLDPQRASEKTAMIHDCHALAVLCPTLAVLMPCYRRADGNYYCCAARPLPGNSCRAAWQLHGNLRCNCTAPRWLPRWLSCAGYAGCHATAMPHCSCCRAVATLHGHRSSCHALATHAPRSRGRRAGERRRLRSLGGLLGGKFLIGFQELERPA